MNKSSLFGLGIVGAVLYVAVFQHTKTPQMFFHTNSLILVLGGTLAVAFIAFPFASLSKAVDYVLWGFLFRKKREYLRVSQDIAGARNAFQNGQNFNTSDDSHPFLKETVVLLLNDNISNEGFEQVLRQRSEYFKKKYKDDAKVLISLAKYPPAFGLLGAAIGMIELMNSMQTATNVNIGSSMMLAFVSTFWGIAVSHFVFLPLADSASKAVDDDHMLRSLIIDGMVLIREQVNDEHFQAYMRGYLSLSDRSEFKIHSRKSILGYSDNYKPNVPGKQKQDDYFNPADLVGPNGDFRTGHSSSDNFQQSAPSQPQTFQQNYQQPQQPQFQQPQPQPQYQQPAYEPPVTFQQPKPNEHDPLAFEQFKASIRDNVNTTQQPQSVSVTPPQHQVATPPQQNSNPNVQGQSNQVQNQQSQNSAQPIPLRRDPPPSNYIDPNETVKAVVGSDVKHVGPQPPDPSQYTMTSTLMRNEQPGRVEEPVKLKQNVEINPQQFKFKDLRKEMKKQVKR